MFAHGHCVVVLQDEEQLFQSYDRLLDYSSDHAHLDAIMQELALEEVRRGGREGEGEAKEGRGDEWEGRMDGEGEEGRKGRREEMFFPC